MAAWKDKAHAQSRAGEFIQVRKLPLDRRERVAVTRGRSALDSRVRPFQEHTRDQHCEVMHPGRLFCIMMLLRNRTFLSTRSLKGCAMNCVRYYSNKLEGANL
jgi:hypothetical protein